MTPEQTTALIALVTWYQRADAAFAADDSMANETALIESLEALLDWREPAPSDARHGMEYTRAYLAELVATGEPVNWRECLTQLLRRLDNVAPTEPLPDVEDWADGLVACAFLQGVRPKLRRPTSADDAVAQILRAERGAIDCPFCGGLFPPLTITPKATP